MTIDKECGPWIEQFNILNKAIESSLHFIYLFKMCMTAPIEVLIQLEISRVK